MQARWLDIPLTEPAGVATSSNNRHSNLLSPSTCVNEGMAGREAVNQA